MSLPRFMVLKSNATNKYLCHGKAKGPTHASRGLYHEMKRPNYGVSPLKSEDKTVFHYLKFEVVPSKTVSGLVHIRTCYNNKFWVRKSGGGIAAEANEPEEDQSKWNCTLFKPIFLGGVGPKDDVGDLFHYPRGIGKPPQKIQLMHVSQHHVVPNLKSAELELIKSTSTNSATTLTTFTASDVEATALLPQYCTFRGQDGKYIGTPNGTDLWFWYSDMGSAGVAMGNNGINVPSDIVLWPNAKQYPGYWMRNPNKDVGVYSTGNPCWTWWTPIKVNNYVALYSKDNSSFLYRKTDNGLRNDGLSITQETKLQVGEPVVQRTILSADYNLDDSRTYGTSSLEKYVDSRSNYTSVEQTGQFQVSYRSAQTMSWNQSVTVNIGIEVSWSFGIPYVGEGGVNVSYERGETWEYGEEKTEEKTVTYTQNITIPPMTKVTLQVVATKSSCDVPFTCKVRDLMTDGSTREYIKYDGLYTGANEFKFQTIIRQEAL